MDKAVIFLHDESLVDDEPVNVYVRSVATISETVCGDGSNGVMGCTVNTKTDTTEKKKKIVLYPVSGGETSDRIGFVEFVVGESGDGQISVKGSYCNLTVTYTSDYFVKDYSATANWSMSEFYGLTCTKDAEIQKGVRDPGKSYVCDADKFRLANDEEIKVGKGCTSYNGKDSVKIDSVDWLCSSGKWIAKIVGTMKDTRDNKTYKTVTIGTQTWMAENLNYDYKVDGESYGNYCDTDNCSTYGRYYTWEVAYNACPTGWHLPKDTEWSALYDAVGKNAYAMGGFVDVDSTAKFWSSTEFNDDYYAYFFFGGMPLGYAAKHVGLSVRCVK